MDMLLELRCPKSLHYAAPSEGGAESWAILASIVNALDPQAYLTDVLERIVSGRTKSHQPHELLSWNWKAARRRIAQAAA
jgi:transposase